MLILKMFLRLTLVLKSLRRVLYVMRNLYKNKINIPKMVQIEHILLDEVYITGCPECEVALPRAK